MKSTEHSVTLAALAVKQRGFRFFSTVIKADRLGFLCAGLTKPITFDPENSLRDQELSAADATKLVKALNEPKFTQEVADLQSEAYDELRPFQRLVDLSRVEGIANYLRQDESMLPNGVILATREDVDVDVKEDADGRITLVIQWSGDQHPLNIIDGQHRVEGLKLLAREEAKEFGAFDVTATILIDLPFWVQAELFAVVNGRQKAVPKSRVYDLLGYLPMSSEEVKQGAYRGEMAVQRFCHHVVKVLQRSEKSPWKDRIKMLGSGLGVISQAALVDHLAPYLQPRKDRPAMTTWPIFYPFYREADVVGLTKTLIIYFAGIRKAHESFWTSNDALKASLFGKTNGVAVVFTILHDLVLLSEGPEHLTIARVSEHWKKVDPAVIANPPKGGSKGYQAQLITAIRTAMRGENAPSTIRPSDDYLDRLRRCGAVF